MCIRDRFQPKSIVVYGGSWAENVIQQCQKMGFSGDIWPIHPHRKSISGLVCFAAISELPGVPDAAFLGINRDAVIEVTRQLAEIGCGGAVCFASGFAETGDNDLQQQLVTAAGDMPLLGPNCYGVLNYLDGAMLWPDQHGGRAVDRGVAIISQSSNIAINISMQARGLPIAYMACVGNQAQTSLADMARSLLADPRVTAAGLYVEGIIDAGDFAAMAADAAARRVVAATAAAASSNLFVKVRHGENRYGCTLRFSKDGDSGSVVIERDDQGLAAGQFAVFYDGDTCLGCGVISATKADEALIARDAQHRTFIDGGVRRVAEDRKRAAERAAGGAA